MTLVDPWVSPTQEIRSIWRDPLDDAQPKGAPIIPTPGTPGEHAYVGLSSSDNPASVAISTLREVNVQGQDEVTLPWGPTLGGEYLIILAPQTFPVVQLSDPRLPANQIGAFDASAGVRTIDGVPFDSWTIGPLNPGLFAEIVVAP